MVEIGWVSNNPPTGYQLNEMKNMFGKEANIVQIWKSDMDNIIGQIHRIECHICVIDSTATKEINSISSLDDDIEWFAPSYSKLEHVCPGTYLCKSLNPDRDIVTSRAHMRFVEFKRVERKGN